MREGEGARAARLPSHLCWLWSERNLVTDPIEPRIVRPEDRDGLPTAAGGREEEAFYILRGEIAFFLDGRMVEVGAGTFLNVPRGTKHRFRNVSDSDAELIFWFAPAGIEGLFDELGEHPEDITAIGERYGTEYFFGE